MPIRLNNTTKVIFSEFWVNMAAGWFGAAIIIPLSSGTPVQINAIALIVDILFGIFSLVIGYLLRKDKKHDKLS